jgi:hypothetical protein
MNPVPLVILACDPRCHATWPPPGSWWTAQRIGALVLSVIAVAIFAAFLVAGIRNPPDGRRRK